MLKRVLLSVFRKRKTNVLLTLIISCLFCLLLIGSSVYMATRKNISAIEKTYGNSFNLGIIRDQSNPDLWEQRTLKDGTQYQVYVGPNVDAEMLAGISETQGIKAYEAGHDWLVLMLGYQVIPGNQAYAQGLADEIPADRLLFSKEETQNTVYMTQMYPTRNSINFEKFYDGTFVLVEGSHIEENNQHVAIISDEFAKINGLTIGEVLTINTNSLLIGSGYPIYSLGHVDVEIIGIFNTTYQQAVSQYTEETDILKNWILVDSQTGEEIGGIYGESTNLYKGTFFVENPSEIEEVMARVRSLDWIDWSYYYLEKNDSLYSNAVKPLRTIRIIMAATIVIVFVVSILLLLFVTLHSVKGRRRESGILMALGIPVKEIRYQYILEYLIVGMTAFIFSLGISISVMPIVNNQITKIVETSDEEKVYTDEEIEAAIIRGENEKVSQMAQNQKKGIVITETPVAKMEWWTVLVLALAAGILIAVCVNYAINKTLKLEPVKVLSMIE